MEGRKELEGLHALCGLPLAVEGEAVEGVDPVGGAT